MMKVFQQITKSRQRDIPHFAHLRGEVPNADETLEGSGDEEVLLRGREEQCLNRRRGVFCTAIITMQLNVLQQHKMIKLCSLGIR